MGRVQRIRGNQLHYHAIALCNNRARRLTEIEDCRQLLEHIKRYSDRHSCAIHDYMIMPSHVHLMLMTDEGNFIDVVMHDICLAFSKYYNKRHNRTGHFWKAPYSAKIIMDDLYALACLRYLSRNPVVAGIADKPEDWKWSGYNYYAHGFGSEIITSHPSYLSLGITATERQQNYRQLVELDTMPAAAERSIFEGRCNEGTRRYKDASRQIIKSIRKFLSQRDLIQQ